MTSQFKKSVRTAEIPERKKKTVQELSELIRKKRTILIASIKNLPASQFQEIGKKLRGKAIVKVPKKNLIFRAIDESGNESVKELKEQIKDNVAILFSDLDSFDLAADLIRKKSPAKAKAGQEAPGDIEIQAGPTELIPGPAISELGAVGITTKVTGGKLEITANKVIVKKGGKISQNVADVMSKLDIKPFSIGFIPLAAFDINEKKLYLDIKIDKEETLERLKTAFSKAQAFAVEIGYTCEDTIKFLIGKASMHEKALSKFVERSSINEENKRQDQKEKPEEVKEEKPGEEKKENTQSDKTEEESKND